MKYKYDDLVGDIENTKLNKIKNNIYLSKKQIDVLNKYNINYLKYNSLSDLIFDIEEILNEELYDDLDLVSQELQEFNYYNNTNK